MDGSLIPWLAAVDDSGRGLWLFVSAPKGGAILCSVWADSEREALTAAEMFCENVSNEKESDQKH